MGKTKKHASVTQKKKNNERLKNNELIVAEDEMQTYAMVTKALGDRRFQCQCKDDILLISLREDDDEKADIIQKYRPEEIHELKKMGEFEDRDFNTEDDEIQNTVLVEDVVWTNDEIDKI